MKELVEVIASALVDDPASVVVTETEDDDQIVLNLTVAPDDMGKVIGKQGRIAKAIRTVVRAAGSKGDKKIMVDIQQSKVHVRTAGCHGSVNGMPGWSGHELLVYAGDLLDMNGREIERTTEKVEDMLRIGIVTTTHGIRGEVKVFPTTDEVSRFQKCDEVILVTKEGNLVLHVSSVKHFKDK